MDKSERFIGRSPNIVTVPEADSGFDAEFDRVKQLRDRDTESLGDSAPRPLSEQPLEPEELHRSAIELDGAEPVVPESPSDQVAQCPCGSALASECDEPSCSVAR